MLDEVEDLDDAGVGDLGEELTLGHRNGLRFGITEMQEPLENYPPVADIAIDREVDPSQAAVRDGPLNLVLTGHQFALFEKWAEVESGTALGAGAVLSCLGACALTTDWFVAFPTEAFSARGRSGHSSPQMRGRSAGRGNLDQAAAEAQLSPRPAAAGSSGAAGRGGGRGRRGSSYLGRGRFETLVGARGFGLGAARRRRWLRVRDAWKPAWRRARGRILRSCQPQSR